MASNVASTAPVSFDTRVIVASKKDLWAETQAGRFREDLFFKLSVFRMKVPALRERPEDVPMLARDRNRASVSSGLMPSAILPSVACLAELSISAEYSHETTVEMLEAVVAKQVPIFV